MRGTGGGARHLARHAAAWLLASAPGIAPWRLVSRQPRRWIRVLYYHQVPDAAVSTFARQLRFLKEHYSVVPMDRALDMVEEGMPEGRYVAITFDDGFLDNYTNAAPLLAQYGLPATFLVATGFIDSSGSRKTEEDFCRERLCVSWRPAMRWEHLKEMVRQGFEVGSHTVNHRRLADLEPQELEREARSSRERIQDALGVPCQLIAYPFGQASDVSSPALSSVRQAGYRACLSAVRGFNSPGVHAYGVRRDHVEASWPLPLLRLVIEGGLDPWHVLSRRRLLRVVRQYVQEQGPGKALA